MGGSSRCFSIIASFFSSCPPSLLVVLWFARRHRALQAHGHNQLVLQEEQALAVEERDKGGKGRPPPSSSQRTTWCVLVFSCTPPTHPNAQHHRHHLGSSLSPCRPAVRGCVGSVPASTSISLAPLYHLLPSPSPHPPTHPPTHPQQRERPAAETPCGQTHPSSKEGGDTRVLSAPPSHLLESRPDRVKEGKVPTTHLPCLGGVVSYHPPPPPPTPIHPPTHPPRHRKTPRPCVFAFV